MFQLDTSSSSRDLLDRSFGPQNAADRIVSRDLREIPHLQTTVHSRESAVHRTDVDFEVVSDIRDVQVIAVGRAILDLPRLRRLYGPGRWRKVKGIATIRLSSGRLRLAELHWYEAHGIGKKEIKRKRYLD